MKTAQEREREYHREYYRRVTKPKRQSQRERRRTQRDGQPTRCYYCGEVTTRPSVDHVIPTSRGGSDTPDNQVVSCLTCNNSKNSDLIEEWRHRIKVKKLLEGVSPPYFSPSQKAWMARYGIDLDELAEQTQGHRFWFEERKDG